MKALSELQTAFIEVFKYKPALVMIDVDYNDSEEFHLCKTITTSPLTEDCKLILLSTNPDIHNIALLSNATDFIAKPFDIAEFNLKVHRQLKSFQIADVA